MLMGTMIDYVQETPATFAEKPFCAVDSLVLSQLCYIRFDGLIPGPEDSRSVGISELTGEEAVTSLMKDVRVPELNAQLLQAMAESPRFRGVRLTGYVNKIDKEKQEQFSAVTYLFGGFSYVAFRGTDSSYVAWKEDFDLAFRFPVPSQVDGAAYLTQMAERLSGPILVGGHSKGGNLAVYSAVFCEQWARERISAVFSHDGPGFQADVLRMPEFDGMRDRIHKTIPQSSLVGVLLQHQENYRIIRSSSFWIMQHDPFSWMVENGEFLYVESLTSGAQFLDESLNQWISSLSEEQLSAFSDALYQILLSFSGDTFSDLPTEWWKTALSVLEGMKGIDADTRSTLLRTVGSLFTLAVRNLPRPSISIPLPKLPFSLPRSPFSKKSSAPEG